jgi:hypothetical protein
MAAAAKNKREIYLTPQPDWAKLKLAATPEEKEKAFAKADQFVHYEIENKAKVTAMKNWIRKQSGWSKEHQQQVCSLPDWFFINIGKIAWIANKLGYMAPSFTVRFNELLPSWLEQSIKSYAEELDAEAEQEAQAKVPESEKKVVSIQDRMADQVSDLCGEWEGKLDELLDGKLDLNKFEPYNDMRSYKEGMIKTNHAKIIKEQFSSGYQEAMLVAVWEDEDIKEGYSHLTAKMRKQFLEFFNKINTACDTYINTGKAQRKTKVPKAHSKEKLIAKLRYQVNEKDLGIASINPVEIIDAKEVWIYNTKTRKLGVYRADDMGPGIGVKGTTLLHFIESKSVQKTLRKPKEQLAAFKGNARTKYNKAFDDIRSTDVKLNGRLNEQTIILKAF